jgi:glucose-6-phosphate isomerase
LVTSTQEQLPKLDEEPQMLSDVLMSLKNSVLLEQIRKRPTDNAILPNELFCSSVLTPRNYGLVLQMLELAIGELL